MKAKEYSRKVLAQTAHDLKSKILGFGLICGVIFVPVAVYNATRDQATAGLAYTFIIYTLNLTGFLLAFRLAGTAQSPFNRLNSFLSETALKLPQFLAVSLIQLLTGTPLFIGLFLLLQALAIGVQAWWLWPVGLLLISLSVYLSVKWSLAGVLVATRETTSLKALKQSFGVTKKKFLRTAGYLALYFVLAIIISTVIFGLLNQLPNLAENKFINGLVSGLLLAFMVPVYACYLKNIVAGFERRLK